MTRKVEHADADKRTRRRHIRIALHLIGWPLLGLICALVAVVVYVGPRVSGKLAAPRSDARPKARAEPAEPIPQFESHTCGLLSLAAAYRAYGLSDEDKNLRFRLGVDRVAHPFDETSTGTLHPDLLRVIVQDGFRYTLIDPASLGAEDLVRAHLDAGDVALFLIARRENGALHWVMSDAVLDHGRIRVVDSLRSEPAIEPAGDFLRDLALSIVAIAPLGNAPELSVLRAHADGGAEMKRVYERLSLRAAAR
jgi:hypothetical protein